MDNYYEVLHVSREATHYQIKTAYDKQVPHWHVQSACGDAAAAEQAEIELRRLNYALETLLDSSLREDHDQFLDRGKKLQTRVSRFPHRKTSRASFLEKLYATPMYAYRNTEVYYEENLKNYKLSEQENDELYSFIHKQKLTWQLYLIVIGIVISMFGSAVILPIFVRPAPPEHYLLWGFFCGLIGALIYVDRWAGKSYSPTQDTICTMLLCVFLPVLAFFILFVLIIIMFLMTYTGGG
jgi:hypothetical protein